MSGTFERAADALESGEIGWTKGVLHDGQGNYCALGAIDFAVGNFDSTGHYIDFSLAISPRFMEAKSTLASTIHAIDPRFNSVADWNDQDEREKQDVIDVLRKCAANYPSI